MHSHETDLGTITGRYFKIVMTETKNKARWLLQNYAVIYYNDDACHYHCLS